MAEEKEERREEAEKEPRKVDGEFERERDAHERAARKVEEKPRIEVKKEDTAIVDSIADEADEKKSAEQYKEVPAYEEAALRMHRLCDEVDKAAVEHSRTVQDYLRLDPARENRK